MNFSGGAEWEEEPLPIAATVSVHVAQRQATCYPYDTICLSSSKLWCLCLRLLSLGGKSETVNTRVHWKCLAYRDEFAYGPTEYFWMHTRSLLYCIFMSWILYLAFHVLQFHVLNCIPQKFMSCIFQVICSANAAAHGLASFAWRWVSNVTVVGLMTLSLIHIWRCRRSTLCRSRWSPYH